MDVWTEQTRFAGYLSRLPAKESELVQLDPGALALSRIDVRGHDSFVIRYKTGARSIWTMVPESEWVGFLVPISWSGDYLLNGWQATTNSVFQLDGAHEYHVTAEHRDAVTVGVRRLVLARTIRSLSGCEYIVDPQPHRKIEVSAKDRHRLLSILWRLMSGAVACGLKDEFLTVPSVVENDMISELAEWIIDLETPEIRDLKDHRNDLAVVSTAIAATRRSQCAKMSLADLCQATGVKRSRLHQAFSEVHGISPGQYLFRRRLTLVRERLLEADNGIQSIKSMAIQHGFLSSGRFANAYRSMFGELPRETLELQLP